MALCGRSAHPKEQAVVRHPAHLARGTSVPRSPAAQLFCLSKWAMPNSKTSILINFSVFLLKSCFGALWKSPCFLLTPREKNSHLQVKPSEKQIDGWHWPYLGQKFTVVLKVAFLPLSGRWCLYRNSQEANWDIYNLWEHVHLVHWTLQWCK